MAFTVAAVVGRRIVRSMGCKRYWIPGKGRASRRERGTGDLLFQRGAALGLETGGSPADCTPNSGCGWTGLGQNT